MRDNVVVATVLALVLVAAVAFFTQPLEGPRIDGVRSVNWPTPTAPR